MSNKALGKIKVTLAATSLWMAFSAVSNSFISGEDCMPKDAGLFTKITKVNHPQELLAPDLVALKNRITGQPDCPLGYKFK